MIKPAQRALPESLIISDLSTHVRVVKHFGPKTLTRIFVISAT